MKAAKKVLLASGFWIAAAISPAHAQSFANLNFESATVVSNNPAFGFLDWSLALPSWSHSAGPDTGAVYYSSTHVGLTPWFLLVSANSRPDSLLQGNFSVSFANGFGNSNGTGPLLGSYLSQTGLVPANTQSIRLQAKGPVAVSLGGINIPLVPLGGNEFGANVSSFAGSITELKLLNASTTSQDPVVFDNIRFSNVAVVPEPAGAWLMGAGLLAVMWRRRRGVDGKSLIGNC
jgi:PEP-CTERM motif